MRSEAPCQLHENAALDLGGEQNLRQIPEFHVPGAQEILARDAHFQVVVRPPPQRGIRSHIRRDIRSRQARNISDRDIPLDIPKDELDRRLKVFGGNHFGIGPTINLHGIEFRAVLPQG